MLTLLPLELLTNSLFFVLLPFLVIVLAVPAGYSAALTWPGMAPVYDSPARRMVEARPRRSNQVMAEQVGLSSAGASD